MDFKIKMKKILALMFVLFLVAGCGSTGNVTKDVTSDSLDNQIEDKKCGDGVCDSDEMCNIDTLESGCPDDCGNCPSYLYTKGFDCGTNNCEETEDNTFEITGTSNLKLEIANLGEVLANTLSIDSFKCYSDNQKAVSSVLLANYNGMIFTQNFDGGKDEVRLTARGSKTDRTTYRLYFTEDNKKEDFDSPFELKCNVEIKTHSPMQGKSQTVYLKFNPK